MPPGGDAPEDFAALSDLSGLMAWGGAISASSRRSRGIRIWRPRGRGTGRRRRLGAYTRADGPAFDRSLCDGGARDLEPGAIAEVLTHAWMEGATALPCDGETRPDPDMGAGYSWCKAPRLAGRPVEVDALARMVVDGHPLAGGGVPSRAAGRLLELGRTQAVMEAPVEAIPPGAVFMAQGRLPAEGRGAGLVGAARGAGSDWLRIERERIAGDQISAPTTWTFSPRDAAMVPRPLEPRRSACRSLALRCSLWWALSTPAWSAPSNNGAIFLRKIGAGSG